MELHKRGLNKGETFCCSVKKVKELFKDTEIHLDFASFYKSFILFKDSPPLISYVKNHIRGKVICDVSMMLRQESPILSFYVLKENEYPNELKEEFEERYLPQFYEFYMRNLNDTSLLTKQRIFMCIELIDGKLALHTTTL